MHIYMFLCHCQWPDPCYLSLPSTHLTSPNLIHWRYTCRLSSPSSQLQPLSWLNSISCHFPAKNHLVFLTVLSSEHGLHRRSGWVHLSTLVVATLSTHSVSVVHTGLLSAPGIFQVHFHLSVFDVLGFHPRTLRLSHPPQPRTPFFPQLNSY